MIGILFLLLRLVLVGLLYAFLLWALYILWSDLRMQTLALQAPQIPPVTLEVTNLLEEQPATFDIPEILIGRSAAANYTIRNETVSSQHARLSYHHHQWWVEDLKSTNGTFLNGERVVSPTVVMNGDELRCGQVNIRVTLQEPQKQPSRRK
jgi:pSer/pThr/pTyr-binding forkhead associated (FHA) protein